MKSKQILCFTWAWLFDKPVGYPWFLQVVSSKLKTERRDWGLSTSHSLYTNLDIIWIISQFSLRLWDVVWVNGDFCCFNRNCNLSGVLLSFRLRTFVVGQQCLSVISTFPTCSSSEVGKNWPRVEGMASFLGRMPLEPWILGDHSFLFLLAES